MICSQNEVTGLLYKAAVGAGLPVGLAQDLAKAGAWLCATGRPGMALAVDVLGSESVASDLDSWCSAFELLAAGVVEEITLAVPIGRELLKAFAHLAGIDYKLTYVIEPQADGGVVVSYTREPAASPKMTDVIRVEPGVLLLANELAEKTYVPASDASRLSGAGAGLTDND